MKMSKHPIAFWVITVFLFISLILLLLGQTMAVIDYNFAVSLGFQESIIEVGEFGMQINRAFGASDTLVYIPLIILSIVGLFLRKKWALFTSAAVMGISSYWATTAAFIFYFLIGVPNFNFVPGIDYWLFMAVYITFGVWGLLYIILRGDNLLMQN